MNIIYETILEVQGEVQQQPSVDIENIQFPHKFKNEEKDISSESKTHTQISQLLSNNIDVSPAYK